MTVASCQSLVASPELEEIYKPHALAWGFLLVRGKF